MASEKLQIILELVTGQYKKEAKEAATATGQIGSAARGSTSGIAGLQNGLSLLKGAVAAVGAGTLIRELNDMATAAAEDERAQASLAGALRTNIGATDDMIAANERWISTMQIATTTADNDLRQAITDLTVAGRSLEDAQNDVAIAIDIAASKGIDLTTVIKGMSRALATGSTGGFGRLGIETKNAAGEMLTYDEVLKNAAETMGGAAATAANTFAGAIERTRIAMEEAREEAGRSAVGPMTVLASLWNEVQIALLGGDEQIGELLTHFNLLLSQGINPMENALATAIDTLKSLNEVDLSAGTLDTLITMLALTEDEVLELRSALLLSEDAFGMDADAAARLTGLLDELVGNLDPAVLATRRYQRAQQDAAGATSALADEIRALTDPTFAVLHALNQAADASRNYVTAVQEHGAASEEAERAALDLGEAEGRLNSAAEKFATEGGPRSVEAVIAILTNAGVAADTIDRIRDAIEDLNATPITAKRFPLAVTGPSGAGVHHRQHGGPVRAGHPYIVGEAGPEWMVPGQSGMILPHGMAMGSAPTYVTKVGPTLIINNPNTHDLRTDAQYLPILMSVTNLVENG